MKIFIVRSAGDMWFMSTAKVYAKKLPVVCITGLVVINYIH
ncbi:hypothetical protein AAFM79_13515 [Trichormus azollae HNT15244]